MNLWFLLMRREWIRPHAIFSTFSALSKLIRGCITLLKIFNASISIYVLILLFFFFKLIYFTLQIFPLSSLNILGSHFFHY
jgi:hypothetical protein